MSRFILLLLLSGIWASVALGQSAYIPYSTEYYHLIDRYEIKGGHNALGYQSTVKPYQRKDVIQLIDSVRIDKQADLSDIDKFNIQYLKNDSWEWGNSTTGNSVKPFLKPFYEKKSDLYSLQNKDIDLHINPVFYGLVGYGKDVPDNTFINTRGIEIRGAIGKKLAFYTYVTDTQLRLAGYFQERIRKFSAVPGEGAWKIFHPNAAYTVEDNSATDFFTARGYITFKPIKQIGLQFGQDKVFIGNGYRSMILSDNSGPMLFLKITTNIGRVQYVNLFSEIMNWQADIAAYGDLPPKKFLAFHHLGINIGDNFNVGVFESIVHSRDKSQGYFDFNYMNPVIFYRAIEAQKYSADNSLLGADFKWNFCRQFQVYGQLLLDEFNLQKLREGNGWWGNKIGTQLGAKYIDAFNINNLDIQAEVNLARPYTYEHISDLTNYVSYNQSLAHPLGANFQELIGRVYYQPIPRLNLMGMCVVANYGLDSDDGVNYGSNPLLSYDARPANQEYGYYIGQGINTNLAYTEFSAAYQLRHNLFIDFRQIFRRQNSTASIYNRSTGFSLLSIRLNIAQRQMAF
ncbi:MAG: hypothetical protein QM669_06950 [Siphonobacter sp.]